MPGGMRGRAAAAAPSPPLEVESPGARLPATAGKLFFTVRDEEEPSVMEALAGGLRDPKCRYLPDQQDLMFFAAARRHGLGGAEVIARRLSALGVPGNSTDRLRQTPLFFAAREGNRECATFLVEQSCDVNHRDVFGQSALFYSVRESHLDMCRLLLQLGASFDLRDNNKNTARFYAKGDIELALTQLVEGGHPHPEGRKAPQGEKVVLAQSGKAATTRKRRRLEYPSPEATVLPRNGHSLAENLPSLSRRAARSKALLASGRDGVGLAVVEEATPDAPLRRAGGGPSAVEAMAAWAEGPGQQEAAGTSSPAEPVPDEAFARAGEYYVCNPAISDAARLRELEREFVADHFEVFREEPWHEELEPSDWCRLVNVIEDEERAQQAIANIILGQTPCHGTLQCVYAPSAPASGSSAPPPSIVGYVHVVNAGGHLDVSHLKVGRLHQRRGLGSLLIAGTVRWAEQQGAEVRDLRLVVVTRNAPAVSLYRALGFENLTSVTKQVRLGSGLVEWQKMWRNFHGMAPGAFARLCEARSSATMQREPA